MPGDAFLTRHLGPLAAGLSGGWDSADLLHDSKSVEILPILDGLPIGNAANPDRCDAHQFATRREAHELACLCSGDGHARHDSVTVGNHILDRQLKVGESSAG